MEANAAQLPQWSCNVILPEGLADQETSAPQTEQAGQTGILDMARSLFGRAPQPPPAALPPGLTVGTKFELNCQGSPANLTRSGLRFELPKEAQFAIRLIEAPELSETGARLVVTSHVAGEHQFEKLRLVSQDDAVELAGVRYAVQSVLNPQENPEGQPYGPTPPIALAWPVWVWAVIAVALFALVAGGLIRVTKSIQRKRLLDELAQHSTALSPVNQFNKDLRLLGRTYPLPLTGQSWTSETTTKYFEDLNRHFRLFLVRELRVPALDWSSGAVLREIKRTNKTLFKLTSRDLRLVLRELDRATESAAKMNSVDAQQLAELCRKVADLVSQTHMQTQKNQRRGPRLAAGGSK